MVKGAEPGVERKVDAIEDAAQGFLAAIQAGTEIPPKELDNLVKKRKLVKQAGLPQLLHRWIGERFRADTKNRGNTMTWREEMAMQDVTHNLT